MAIVVGVIALLLNLRSESKTLPGQTKALTQNDSTSGDTAGQTMVHTAATEPKKQPAIKRNDPDLLREEERTEEFERLLAREIPGRIREATAHCYDGSGKSYKQLESNEESLEFDYTARLKSGVFTLEDLKITKKFGNKIDGCVKQALTRLSWRDTVNPDFTMKMGDSITLLELKKWGEPMPHELEEVPEDPPEDEY